MSGHTEIFNMEVGTLIYGAGKGILRSFQDFDLCAEPYMTVLEIRFFTLVIWTMRELEYMRIW